MPTTRVVDGKKIETAWHSIAGAQMTILMLHEALGSVSAWRDFPQRLGLATGANVLVYSRAGHGLSDGPLAPRTARSYRDETERVIPLLLQQFQAERLLVYGHSEGAGIALLYAAGAPNVSGLILECPIVSVTPGTGRVIQTMSASYASSELQRKLSRHHANADAVFSSWVETAATMIPDASPFLELMAEIKCPVLTIQGAHDPFPAAPHYELLRAGLPQLQRELLTEAGHMPHREQTELVLQRVAHFVKHDCIVSQTPRD